MCEVVTEDGMTVDKAFEEAGEGGEGAPPGVSGEEEGRARSVREVVADWKAEGRELCKRFGGVISSQKEKKRITVVVAAELEEIRDRYEAVFIRLWEENSKLEGKLEENRRYLREFTEERVPPRSAVVVETGTAKEDRSAMSSQAVKGSEDRKVEGQKGKGTSKPKVPQKEARREVKKDVRKECTAEARGAGSEAKTQGKRKDDGEFIEVKRKKKERKAAEERKRESWRAREPPKSFIIPAGEGGAEAAKKSTWAEIAGKIGAPQLVRTVVMPRGDIRVFPGSDRTVDALRELEREGKLGVREARQRWPKVLVYDVDRSIGKEELPSALGLQNPDLELERGMEGKAFMPIFQKGAKVSKEGDKASDKVTNWVCEVSPALFNRLAGRMVFLGFGRSKVVEWHEVLQCKGCQGFGHMEKKCMRKRLICGYCAKEGHRKGECKAREGPPKCFNCGKLFQAGHLGCEVRRSVARATMERTCYGSK